jgi:MFS transporter, FHS family, L-fucose permease
VALTPLFVIASGITLLQVAANHYMAVIGPPQTSSARFKLALAGSAAITIASST